MKEDAGDEEIDIQLWIDRMERKSSSHHLSDVFDEPATACVVVFLRCPRAAEAVPELV